MAQGQFLVRNRHQQVWYGRVVIPGHLRDRFNQRRELRVSLDTSDKQKALRRSRHFWLQCQSGFERLEKHPRKEPFEDTRAFISWLSRERQGQGQTDMAYYIETFDVFGRKHVIDLDDPEKEKELALALQANAIALLESYKNRPEVLDRLMKIGHTEFSAPDNQPESPTTFHEAIGLYIDKLESQGRKGKKLAQRTLYDYKDKLGFWQTHFGQRPMHTLTLKELGEIQNWLPWLPANCTKKLLSVDHAVRMAQNKSPRYPAISDKTRSDYLGQLKGLLEFAYANGFIKTQMASHIEIPNTKHSQTIERLPFTTEDMQKIFPGKDYGKDFGIQKAGIGQDCKFWFPLLAAFTGARLEELAQLQTEDIRTSPDTGIVYAMIDNKGVAADGAKKHTKNLNSVRPIPIHSTLIQIGFMDFVATRQNDKTDGSLFKLSRDNQGRLGKGVSNWFSRVEQRKNGGQTLGYIERRGVESKGQNDARERWSKSFHSFRHTVIDNLRGKQFPNGDFIREPDIALVVGHERNKLETASYGIDRSQLELRKAVVEAIKYNNVPFATISW
ncbi:MAG: site-specific integrase [Porticoccaceae bacterium]